MKDFLLENFPLGARADLGHNGLWIWRRGEWSAPDEMGK